MIQIQIEILSKVYSYDLISYRFVYRCNVNAENSNGQILNFIFRAKYKRPDFNTYSYKQNKKNLIFFTMLLFPISIIN